MKAKVSREEAISTFRKMFNIGDEESKSMEASGRFLVIKTEFERYEVIDKLQEWFSANNIDGCYVEISPITLLYTGFDIKSIEELE